MAPTALLLILAAPTEATVPTPPQLPESEPVVPASDDEEVSAEESPNEEPASPDPSSADVEAPATPEPQPTQPSPEPSAQPDPFTSQPPPEATSPPTEPVPETPSPRDDENPLSDSSSGDYPGPDPNDTYNRKGMLLSVSAGLASCREPLCADIAIAGHGRFELGYRAGMVAPFVGVSIGGAKIDVDDFGTAADPVQGGSGSLRLFDVGGGIQFAPNKEGRLDPFFVAALGFSRVHEQFEIGAQSFEITFNRGGVRLGTGLGIYLARRIALAPRFDMVLPFAGRLCTVEEDTLTTMDECSDISDLLEDEESDYLERLSRKSLPRPWSVALDLRMVF